MDMVFVSDGTFSMPRGFRCFLVGIIFKIGNLDSVALVGILNSPTDYLHTPVALSFDHEVICNQPTKFQTV
jgi:hypothetical protein